MDFDFITIVISVLLAALFGWFEKRSKKADKASSAPTGRNRSVAHGQTREVVVVPPMKTYTSPYAPEREADRRKLEKEVERFAEGQRVTSDTSAMAACSDAAPAGIKHPDIDGLRNAVIWSEILRRKF